MVPESARVGPEGAGAMLFHESMIWERGCLFAYYVGAMERVLARCVEHARTRAQFGATLGAFQSVSNRIVDMKLRLETEPPAALPRAASCTARASAATRRWR